MTTNPARRRNGGIAIGAVSALVAGGLTAAALRDDSSPPAPAAYAAPALRETTGVTGRAVVVAPGGAVSIVDLATGEATRLFTDDRLSYAVRVGTSVVVGGGAQGGSNGRVYAVAPDGSYDGLPPATGVLADAEGTGVWAFSLAKGVREPEVRHYDLAGRPLGPVVAVPAYAGPVGVYDGGLVLNQGESYNVHLWDPGTGRTRSHRDHVVELDTTTNRIAWRDEYCERDCPVTWADLPSRLTRPGGRLEIQGVARFGRFSPDGSWLALGVVDGADPLLVCEVAAGTCARPRHATAGLRFAWAADGRTLLVADPATERLAAWRPGWEDLRLLPGRHPVTTFAALGS